MPGGRAPLPGWAQKLGPGPGPRGRAAQLPVPPSLRACAPHGLPVGTGAWDVADGSCGSASLPHPTHTETALLPCGPPNCCGTGPHGQSGTSSGIGPRPTGRPQVRATLGHTGQVAVPTSDSEGLSMLRDTKGFPGSCWWAGPEWALLPLRPHPSCRGGVPCRRHGTTHRGGPWGSACSCHDRGGQACVPGRLCRGDRPAGGTENRPFPAPEGAPRTAGDLQALPRLGQRCAWKRSNTRPSLFGEPRGGSSKRPSRTPAHKKNGKWSVWFP